MGNPLISLDGVMKTRIEAFVEMLKYHESETPVESKAECLEN